MRSAYDQARDLTNLAYDSDFSVFARRAARARANTLSSLSKMTALALALAPEGVFSDDPSARAVPRNQPVRSELVLSESLNRTRKVVGELTCWEYGAVGKTALTYADLLDVRADDHEAVLRRAFVLDCARVSLDAQVALAEGDPTIFDRRALEGIKRVDGGGRVIVRADVLLGAEPEIGAMATAADRTVAFMAAAACNGEHNPGMPQLFAANCNQTEVDAGLIERTELAVGPLAPIWM
ncbi:MAG TPA: hypothetical protein VLH84_01395 [Patescibacteria group bacterium]|nr:hypothetical protein [Patescibacteria group bacterium]